MILVPLCLTSAVLIGLVLALSDVPHSLWPAPYGLMRRLLLVGAF